MGVYDSSIALALRLIKAKGRKLSFFRQSSVFDPTEGGETQMTETEGSIYCVTLPASKGTIEAFDDRVVDDIVAGKLRYVLCAAAEATFPPESEDEFVFDEKRWRVLGVTPLAPNGEPIVYKIGVRLL